MPGGSLVTCSVHRVSSPSATEEKSLSSCSESGVHVTLKPFFMHFCLFGGSGG
jgi:cellobiose-specific phosphotransferase system component IIC